MTIRNRDLIDLSKLYEYTLELTKTEIDMKMGETVTFMVPRLEKARLRERAAKEGVLLSQWLRKVVGNASNDALYVPITDKGMLAALIFEATKAGMTPEQWAERALRNAVYYDL